MNVKVTTGVSMAVRICLEASAVAVPKDTCNTTNGTNVLMKMNVPTNSPVVLLPATTPWAASNVFAHLDLTLSSHMGDARM